MAKGITPEEQQALDDLAYVRKNLGGGGRYGSKPFQQSLKKSRDVSLGSEDLPKIMADHYKSIGNKIKDKWQEALPGSGIKKANRHFEDALNDFSNSLSKAGKNVTKSIMDSFSNIQKITNGSSAAQVAASAALAKYSKNIEEFNEHMHKSMGKAGSKERAAYSAETKRINKNINISAQEAGTHGFTVKNAADFNTLRKDKKALAAYVDEIGEATNHIADLHAIHGKNLEVSYANELTARKAMVIALTGFVFDIGKRIFETTPARLQNVMASTDYYGAAKRGLSPQEQLEYNNKNRTVNGLLGGQGAGDAYLDASRTAMEKYGLWGKEASDRITQLSKIQMTIGAKPTVEGTNQIQNAAAGYQVIANTSQQEAVDYTQKVAESSAFLVTTIGKNGAETIDLLKQQVTSMALTARHTGLAADYFMDQLNQAHANRNASMIEKFKANIMTPIAINMARNLGANITGEQSAAMTAVARGSMDDNDLALSTAGHLAIGKTMQEARQRASGTSKTGGDFSQMGPMAAFENVMGLDKVNKDVKDYEDSVKQIQTTALGVPKDVNGVQSIIDASKNSLSTAEIATMNVATMYVGAQKSAIGGVMSGVGSIAKDAAEYFAFTKFTKLGQALTGMVPAAEAVAGEFGTLGAVGGGMAAFSLALGGAALVLSGIAGWKFGSWLHDQGEGTSGADKTANEAANAGGGIKSTALRTKADFQQDATAHMIPFFGQILSSIDAYNELTDTNTKVDMTSPAALAQIAKTRETIRLHDSMVSGKQIDDNNQEVVQNDINKLLEKIGVNTGQIAKTTDAHLDYTKDADAQKAAQAIADKESYDQKLSSELANSTLMKVGRNAILGAASNI